MTIEQLTDFVLMVGLLWVTFGSSSRIVALEKRVAELEKRKP